MARFLILVHHDPQKSDLAHNLTTGMPILQVLNKIYDKHTDSRRGNLFSFIIRRGPLFSFIMARFLVYVHQDPQTNDLVHNLINSELILPVSCSTKSWQNMGLGSLASRGSPGM